MNEQLLFIDGSVNARTRIGIGAFLCVNDSEQFSEHLKSRIKTKRFENTSSTKLELQTLLWALEEIQIQGLKVKIITDSQNIVRLLTRRERLEKNNYTTKSNKRINNFELYRQFYNFMDRIGCELVQVKGHKRSSQKDKIDKLFSLVDKAARKTQRNENKETKQEYE